MGAIIAVPVRFRLQELLADQDPPLSQSELSRRSGVSMTTINAMVLNKTKQVSLATLDALCAILEVEPGELLAREGKPGRRAARG
jgi:DNA-binding Xre family transcriptional regulator